MTKAHAEENLSSGIHPDLPTSEGGEIQICDVGYDSFPGALQRSTKYGNDGEHDEWHLSHVKWNLLNCVSRAHTADINCPLSSYRHDNHDNLADKLHATEVANADHTILERKR